MNNLFQKKESVTISYSALKDVFLNLMKEQFDLSNLSAKDISLKHRENDFYIAYHPISIDCQIEILNSQKLQDYLSADPQHGKFLFHRLEKNTVVFNSWLTRTLLEEALGFQVNQQIIACDTHGIPKNIVFCSEDIISEKEPEKDVYILTEIYEDRDGIREFHILNVGFEPDILIDEMRSKIQEDEYGYIKKNGVYIDQPFNSITDWAEFSTDYNEGFVSYSIQKHPISSALTKVLSQENPSLDMEEKSSSNEETFMYPVRIKQILEGVVEIPAANKQEALLKADILYNQEGHELPDMDDVEPLTFECIFSKGLSSEKTDTRSVDELIQASKNRTDNSSIENNHSFHEIEKCSR